MQGNCSATPPAALDPPRTTASQCVLTIQEDFLELAQPALWLSHLYLHIVGGARKDHSTIIGIHGDLAAIYMTDVVMHGDNLRSRAVDVRERRRSYSRGALLPSCAFC